MIDEPVQTLAPPPDEQWQTLALALARLAAQRPGWLEHLGAVATTFAVRDMFEQLVAIERSDRHEALLDIVIAVKDGAHVDEDELRLAILAQSAMQYFLTNELRELVAAVEDTSRSPKLRAQFAGALLERLFLARGAHPERWLGPANIPGNPEYETRYAASKRLLAKIEHNAVEAPPPAKVRIILSATPDELQALHNLLGYFESVAEDAVAESRPSIELARAALTRHGPPRAAAPIT